MITQKKWDQLKDRMHSLEIYEKDLEENYTTGGGPGGQKINKTSSRVLLTHRPSNLQIKCQKERSRELNRFYARVLLCDKFEKEILGKKTVKDREQEKIRKQKERRKRRSKSEKKCNF